MKNARILPRTTLRSGLALVSLCVLPRVGSAQAAQIPEIPFEKFVLDNGLTLIVHEDHKAPIVAVNVWYHVGSKNELPGKTGFAHLFEHLMFNGTENFPDDYFTVLEPLGATDLNGTTNNDRTNYFQNVPTSALDVVLWMESDRMGHLMGAIDQAVLDEQRGVVQNEKRQGENQPYGQVANWILENAYPAGHPYSWNVIGSMEDLNAASLEDVNEWFRSYYGAANAVVVIAGDIEPGEARAKVERYFGDIPAGPPVTRQDAWVARRTGTHRMTIQDRVPQARIYKVWNVPEWGSEEATRLDLLARVLGTGRNSRLYRRLVYEEQLASAARADVLEREIGSLFMVTVTALPDADLAAVEAALDEEMARLIREGPMPEELALARTQVRAGFIRGIERIGGFGGKSDVLAMNEVYGGDPAYYRTRLGWVAQARPIDVRETAAEWLTDGQLVLEVHPFTEGRVVRSDVDRSRLPEAGAPPAADFPDIERTTLDNGLEILLARRDAVPLVNLRLVVDAGRASDAWSAPGTANLAMSMLAEGTSSRSTLEISEELERLGATLTTASSLDASTVTMSALTENLEASVELFADVILRPSFPSEELERQRQQVLARIRQESVQPRPMALRVLPKLLYGEGHPYSLPFSGSGDTRSVSAMTTADMRRFHDTWFKSNNATLLVVGDAEMDEVVALARGAFGGWPRGDVPEKEVPEVEPRTGQAVYIMDRPDALQSLIVTGQLAPPKSDPDDLAMATMNAVLGGDFISRMNMNLREDKHWSYGARTLMRDARGQRTFGVQAPVQSDRTIESVGEVVSELSAIVGDRPVTAEERDQAVRGATLGLSGLWETNSAILRSLTEMVEFGLPDDHFDTLAERINRLSAEELTAAARRLVRPADLLWIVVGDKASIEEGLRSLDLGPVYEIDADGNVLGGVVSQ